MGIPAYGVRQDLPHLAYAVASYNSSGDGSWQLYNSGASWGNSSYTTLALDNETKSSPQRQRTFNSKAMLDWGQQYSTGSSNLSYLAIAQEAVNAYSNYKTAEKYVMLANIYKGNDAKQEEYYRKAIQAQNINVDAWYGLVQLYKNSNTYTEEDCLRLIKEFQPIYRTRILAFYDLSGMLIGKIKSSSLNAEAIALRTSTLQWAEVNANSIHRGVAQTLLDKPKSELATFSFDGQYAGQIRLGNMFNEENKSRWEYSIDGGKTWKESEELYVKLTPSELLGVNEKNNILVHIIGTEIRTTIQINKDLSISNIDVYANDAEDAIYVYQNKKIEWRYSDDASGVTDWKSYDEVKPNLSGNRSILVRFAATGTSLPNSMVDFNFTDNKYPAKETYIKTKYLSVVDSTPSGKSTPAKNMIDGNFGAWNNMLYNREYSRWLSVNNTDENKFITIELKEPVYLSRLDYLPSDEQVNEAFIAKPYHGRIMQGEVLGSTDGENWTKLGDITNWANNVSAKTIRFDNPQKVKYVKVVATQTNDGYIGGKGFNLYEDTTKEAPPTATVKYSITQKTNKDVVATLESFSSDTVVVEGASSYTFTENGAHTFNLRDTKTGRTNEIVASVDWIDRVAPTASIQYINLPNTKGYVQARIVNISKNVFVLDENDRPLRLIENSGNYIYEYNLDPDTKQIINQVQKDSNNNIRYVRGFALRDPNTPLIDIFENSNKNLQYMGYPVGNAMGIDGDSEYMIAYQANYTNGRISSEYVYDENLKNATSKYTAEQIAEMRTLYTSGVQEDILKYVFTKNGEKVYKLRDRIGNEAEIKMVVDSINRGPYIAEISYDKSELTNGNVTATLTFKEEGVRITNLDEGIIEVQNGGKYVFTENGDFRFKLIDSENVESYLDAKVSIIDKQVPQGIISYSTTTPTNGNVTATIEFDKANVTVTNNEGSNVHTFTDNGTFIFEFRDEAGNVGTAEATVNCIDRTIPIAVISYSTTDPTNQNVIANIVDSNKNITITNNEGKSTYEFSENGEFKFEFVDEAGNIGEVIAKVDWIDKEEIVPTISYRFNGPTGKAETAIITFNKENVTVTNNNGKTTHRFEDNGTFTFEFRDEAGNTGEATAEVTWIDKVLPTAEVYYDRTLGTKEPVTATVVNPSKDIKITNNGGSSSYTFTNNGKFIFEFEDNAGNPGEVMAEVTWIDNEAPTATITYSTTEDTTDIVVATLHIEDPNLGYMPSTQTHTFTKNGEYTFNFEDSLGNKGTATAKVDWIVSGELTADIKYEKTDEGVLATLVNESRNITVTNNNGNRTYLLTEENNTFTFEYEDAMGNRGSTEANLENMNGPATIEYTFTSSYGIDPVTGKRKLNIRWKANIKLPDGYEMNSVSSPKTYTFSQKGSYAFEYKNAITGEKYKATATVDWFPEAWIEYSTKEPTKDPVEITFHFNRDDGVFSIGNDANYPLNPNTYPHPWTYYLEKKEGTEYTYIVKHNVEFIIEFAHNGKKKFVSAYLDVKNIDETEPVGTIKYSNTEETYRDVTANIEFNKPNVKILNNDGRDTYRFEENGEFTFEYEDAVGHRGTTTAKVDWILDDYDKVVPTVVYSEKEPTNKNVVATVTFDQDDVKVVDEQGVEIPNGHIHTFTENGTYTFNYVDKKGRKGTAIAEVNNIDRDVPIATIDYSTTDKTNKPVIATINFNEDNVIVAGGNTHTFDNSGTYTFSFMDEAGNRGTAIAEVDWINKKLPKATISYDDTELTGRDVTATISFDAEGVVIIDDEGNEIPNGEKYVFTENGSHIFKFRDAYGNEGTAVARVSNIDKVLPVATITYDVTEPTDGSVTATVTFDKRNVIVEGGNKHVFTTNGEYVFNFIDAAGNRGWVVAKVTWINSHAPKATITYSPERPEGNRKVNTDVVATITFEKDDVTVTNNEGNNTYTFNENGTFTFEYEDAEGHKGETTVNVGWIDKEAPRAEIEYSTTELTNKDVTVRLVNASEEITIVNNNGIDTYRFSENGTFEFEIRDNAGNTSKIEARVSNIDKVVPTAKVEYSTKELTNGDVTVRLVNPSEDFTIINNEGSDTYVFSENGVFEFEIRDAAGNTNKIRAEVSNIDKVLPTASIRYSTTDLTNEDVIAYLVNASEEITVINNEGLLSYTFTDNGAFEFEIRDNAGNINKVKAEVSNIDKVVPTAEIEYSTKDLTNQDVTVRLVNPSKDITITNNNGSDTYVFSENGAFEFEIRDNAGNINKVRAEVSNIDKVAPTAEVEYSTTNTTKDDVTAYLTNVSEEVTITNNGGQNSYVFSENGVFEFEIRDAAGNTNKVKAEVTWINKNAPSAEVEYSTKEATNQDVTVRLVNPSEEITITNNEGSDTYVFSENGTFTFKFVNVSGVEGTATAKVDWIDKDAPSAEVEYSTKETTNQDVIVRLVNANEEITITNNNGSDTYVFTENGAFEFEIRDNAGNTSKVRAEVSNIDKVAPSAEIEYSTKDLINQDVTARLVNPSEEITVINNEGLDTYTFTENGAFEFEIRDVAGNTSKVRAEVSNIDKIAPSAEIEYSTKDLTKDDVTVRLVNPSEEITITNNEGSDTYVFTDNGAFEFEIRDNAGNTSTVEAEVSNIDKVAPTANVSYSTTRPTNKNVVVTLVDESEEITVTNNEGSKSYTFTENGEFTFEFEDRVGNKGTAKAVVNNINKNIAEAIITYSPENNGKVNTDVVATVTFNKDDVTITNNEGSNTHTFTENGEFEFEFTDNSGNNGVAVAEVTWIDKVAPTAEIEYSTTELTNQDVTVKLVNASEEITIVNNEGSDTYVFTENGAFEFEIRDVAGNISKLKAEVSNIDKVAPTAEIEYSTKELTNSDVTAKLVNASEEITIVNNESSDTYVFTENGAFEFEIRDAAGNTSKVKAEVSNIDKVAPSAEIEYSTTDLTNKDVTAKLVNASEEITIVNNESSDTYVFTENGVFEFEIRDAAGNTSRVKAEVSNIDKDAPSAEIEYSTTDLTNEDVTAKLVNASEEITIVNNDNSDTYVFTENGAFEFEIRDAAGNTSKVKAEVSNIDKVAPSAEIEYSTTDLTNQDVAVRLVNASEEITIVNNESKDTYTFTENGAFEFEIRDNAGNISKVKAEVSNIDKIAPTAEVTYSTVEETTDKVIATLVNLSEEITITNNDGSDKYEFSENGSFVFEFVDKAGNKGTVEAKVTNIIKEEVEATITYSKNELTNEDVIATVTFDKEDVTITNNEGNNTYTFKENGTFTFEYISKTGVTGTATAEVTWIDKVVPSAEVEYSTTELTNQDVTVRLVNASEEITIVNNEGLDTYVFTENGAFEFEIRDNAGNTSKVKAEVSNIDKVAPRAEIEYSTKDLTNQDVTVKLVNPSEEITIVNNDGSDTYVFTENGTFEFEIRDNAGNTSKIEATVANIDKVVPTASVEYSTLSNTNENVTVKLVNPSEEITIMNNNGSDTHVFTENGTFEFEIKDKAGNINKIKVTVANIDKEAPTAEIEYSTKELTNQDVTVRLVNPSEEVTIINNGGSDTYTFTENGTFEFEIRDATGNTSKIKAEVANIDKVVPRAEIEYSSKEPTNGYVTVKLVNASEDITITNNKGSDTYIFTENGSFVFEFVDKAGNRGTVEAIVTNIIQEQTKATISYSKNELINEDVTATITFNKKDVTITNNNGSDTYVFNENGEFTFEYIDKDGVVGTATAEVTWIDKVAPSAEVEYSTKELTNKDVTVKLVNASEEITIMNNNGSDTYTFTENGAFEFEIRDNAGNTSKVKAEVANIDKVAPVGTITYSTTDLTNGDVIATLTADEEVTITNNKGSNTYVFNENGKFTFEFVDKAGNTNTVEAEVTWINKTPPVGNITYESNMLTNQNVIANLEIGEGVIITNNEGSNTYVFTDNGLFTFEFVDAYGNTGSATAKVDWIDKVLPTAEIEYSTIEVTSDKVIVRLVNASEDIIILNNNGLDKYEFTENGEFTFEFKDRAGNIGSITAKVDWIKKESGKPEEPDKPVKPEEPVKPTNPSGNTTDNSNKNNGNTNTNKEDKPVVNNKEDNNDNKDNNKEDNNKVENDNKAENSNDDNKDDNKEDNKPNNNKEETTREDEEETSEHYYFNYIVAAIIGFISMILLFTGRKESK